MTNRTPQRPPGPYPTPHEPRSKAWHDYLHRVWLWRRDTEEEMAAQRPGRRDDIARGIVEASWPDPWEGQHTRIEAP